jgi:glycosyltransferase involved in cell wall biosynthesis
MKVLMIISQFYPIIGGAEKQAQTLAKKLIEKGIDVNIVTGWWNFGTPRREIIDGIRVVRNFCCWGMWGIKGIRTLGRLIYMASLAIYLLIRKQEYDIIHVHQVLYPAFISTFIGKGILKKPVLVKMGCSGLTSDIKALQCFPLGGLQLKYLVKKMDYLITVNHQSIEEFRGLGYPIPRIQYIPNGVVLPVEGKLQYDQVLFVISTVRLDKQKGIDVLLKAWARVVTRENSLKLLILGRGPLESELENMSQTSGIGDSVKFLGEVIQVEEYLKKSDIFVLASRAEGMSNALLEAMSHGITCIATNISGNAELMGMENDRNIPKGDFIVVPNGLLIQPEDIEGLAKAILFLVKNQRERESLGRNGRKFVHNNYSIDLITDKYIELYQRMVGEKS